MRCFPRCPRYLFLHTIHHEGHIEDVDFVGKNMVGKSSGKIHDAVKGQRSGNQDAHSALLTRFGTLRTLALKAGCTRGAHSFGTAQNRLISPLRRREHKAS